MVNLSITNRILALVLVVAFGLNWAGSHSATLLTKKKPFSRETMEKNYKGSFSYGILDPSRFLISQSYSTSMSFSHAGRFSSGLYLNTLAYKIADPLTFSVDLGIHFPFYSSGMYNSSTDPNILENNSSFVMPRMSLEYRITDNTSLSFHYINVRDTYKAYGPIGGLYGWRSPFSK